MQRLRGEITVFLSLILVCVFSLMMGLLESARTASARLYLQMAADSALFSVMSQYNRNLWDRVPSSLPRVRSGRRSVGFF